MRPLIATTATTYTGNYRTPQVMLGVPYLTEVERPGATALMLTPAHDPASLNHLLDRSHGLVLTGGEDVEPTRYGQEPHPQLGSTNPARDRMEFAVLEGALEREMPILAICRGMQLVNVAFGGTLYQDLPAQRAGDLVHEQTAPINDHWHDAVVEEGSRLSEIFGVAELFINSFHHQGVDRLAPGLRAVARAEDGLVEAVEATEHPWVFGVQWHPERGEAEAPEDRRNPNRRLFWAFVEASRDYAQRAAYAGI
jgi:putative glutamine amidotransferase